MTPRCSSRPGRWCVSWRSARLPGTVLNRGAHAADRARGRSHCQSHAYAARRGTIPGRSDPMKFWPRGEADDPRMTWGEMQRRWPTRQAYQAKHTRFENLMADLTDGSAVIGIPFCLAGVLLGGWPWTYLLWAIPVPIGFLIHHHRVWRVAQDQTAVSTALKGFVDRVFYGLFSTK